MRGAGQALVETVSLGLASSLADMDLDQSVADQQRRRQSGLDGLLVLTADDEAIDDGVHVGDVFRLEPGLLGDVHRLAVHDQRAAPFLTDLGEDELEILAVDLEHRRAHLDLRPLGQRQDRFQDLAGGPARRRLTGTRTVRLADRRVEQVQIARDIGHRPDRGPRVAARRLLFDRDDRREPEHEVHVGLRHLRDEPLRVARERLQVAALPLGVDRVERETRLSRPREPRDDDHLVARNLDRHVPQVVDARTLHRNRRSGFGHSVYSASSAAGLCHGVQPS